MWKQRVVLKDHSKTASFGREVSDVLIIELNGAGVREFKASNHSQRRSLTTTRRSQQTKELALVDVERDVINGASRAEALGNVR